MQKPEFDPQTVREIVGSVLRSEASAIGRLSEQIPDQCGDAVGLLVRCAGRVIVTGMGKMSAIARKTASTFCSIGTPAVFLHPGEAHHGDLGIVTSSDVLLALSNSGETQDIINLVPFMKRHHVPVISITGSTTNSLAQVSDCNLATGVEGEADAITAAPTNSTTATLALCDGLAIALVHLRGFTAEQFAVFHPGGQLGRQLLLRVSDLMASGDAVPLVPETATLREAIVIISQKTLGAGFVVNDPGVLQGIVTDGDLRRILEQHQNPLDQPVSQLMTRQPRTVAASQLAVEALNHMNDFSITVMPVVDEQGHVCGALHVHQLLKAGLT